MNDKILQQYRDFVWGKYTKITTRRTYVDHPSIMLRHIGKPLKAVTQKDVDRYIQYCEHAKKHNGNVVRYFSIATFMRWANRTDIIIPKLVPIDAGKQALDESQTQRLLDIIEELSPLHRLVFYGEYDLIRRPSEMRNIKLQDRKGDLLYYRGKTGYKYCVMTERFKQAWNDYLMIRPIPLTPEDAEYLVLVNGGAYKGQRIHSPHPMLRTIREICLYAGIEIPNGEKPTNYLIKRTSITRQLKECNDPKIIQLQAGHASLKPTMKYNRIEQQDIKKYLNGLEHKKLKHQTRENNNS